MDAQSLVDFFLHVTWPIWAWVIAWASLRVFYGSQCHACGRQLLTVASIHIYTTVCGWMSREAWACSRECAQECMERIADEW